MRKIPSKLLECTCLFLLLLAFGCVGEGSPIPSFVDQGISKVVIELADVESGQSASFVWEITNNGGFVNLERDTLTFVDSLKYNGEVTFLDTLGGDISSQIEQVPEEFQIFYSFSGNVDSVAFVITDRESHYAGGNQQGPDLKVGKRFEITVFGRSGDSGTLVVTLTHFSREVKDGVRIGDDVFTEVVFPLTVITSDTSTVSSFLRSSR